MQIIYKHNLRMNWSNKEQDMDPKKVVKSN